MALSPSRRIFYMKNSTHLQFDYDPLFVMIIFIVMRCVYFQCGISIHRTKLSYGCLNAYLHCGYFKWLPEWLLYLMAIIRTLPASDEPPISEPINATIINTKFIWINLCHTIVLGRKCLILNYH